MKTMKAAVLFETGKPLHIESNIEIPALKRGQVLVKVAYSGVCHSQIMEAQGHRGNDAWLPHLLGHEGSGVVVETGPEVTKVIRGERVVLGWIKGSGIEAGGVQYKLGPTTINAGGVTTFNEFAVVSENRVVKLPEGLPLDAAVMLGCAVPTGAGIIINTVQPAPGSTLAVWGLGGIGMSAVMAARLFSCKRVFAIDREESKLALAREFGATDCINADHNDPVMALRSLTNGLGVDACVEAAGKIDTIESAFSVVRRGGGLCVFASHPPTGSRIQIDPYELICGKRLQGSWGGAVDPDRDLPRFGALYREGKLPLEKMITKRYSLDAINEAMDDLEAGRVFRPLIEIDSSLR